MEFLFFFFPENFSDTSGMYRFFLRRQSLVVCLLLYSWVAFKNTFIGFPHLASEKRLHLVYIISASLLIKC